MKNTPQKLSEKKALGLELILFAALLTLVSFVLQGCEDSCETEISYTYFEPVYTSLEDVRSAVTTLPAEPLRTHGKIFYKDSYLFINEPNKGIHVINNADPSNPINETFINVPGSFDLVVKNNLLYTDSYMDLVIIDISDIDNAIEVSREKDIFIGFNSYGFYVDETRGVVTDWVEVQQVDIAKSDCNSGQVYPWGHYYNRGIALETTANFDANVAVSPGNPGMAGSMSRFALSHDHLYLIDQGELLALSLDNPSQPIPGERVYIDWGIETLFPAKDHLFIGAQNGMHIMNLDEPINPTLLSTYQHVNSCDPVIVDGNYAYVTLRSGNECAGFTNQLEVIEITDLTAPQVEHVYQMTNPHGLGKDGDALFICDGYDGLKVFNAGDISQIGDNLIAHYPSIDAFDIIPFNKVAMMIGEDGLYQYDYSDLNNIKLLSHLKITPEL